MVVLAPPRTPLEQGVPVENRGHNPLWTGHFTDSEGNRNNRESACSARVAISGSTLSFVWPTTHGALADNFGFEAAFIFALVAALFSLVLISRLPRAEARGKVES